MVRENDDGRRTVVKSGMSWDAAEEAAGALRDAMTEDEVAAGFNYVAAGMATMKDSSRNEGWPNEYR